MKKTGMVCMMILCFTMSSRSSALLGGWLDDCLEFSEQKTEQLREDLKDKTKMRECMNKLLGSRLTDLAKAGTFKQKFDVSDEAMQGVLMDIIRESSVKAGLEKYQQSGSVEVYTANWHLREAIKWMETCANAEGKRLLMDIATDNSKDDFFRSSAIRTYMSRADMQEKWDTVVRFLADDEVRLALRFDFNAYSVAMEVYDRAENDTQKREAIVVAISAALAKEEDKKAFAEADKLLAERSTEYAESPQRKAALERMNKPPEKETP